MKSLNKVIMPLMTLVLLTGCSGLKQVSYEEFHNKALEAADKSPSYEKITMKGKISYAGFEVNLNGVKLEKTEDGWEFKEGEIASKAAALAIIAAVAATQIEVDGCKYYAGNGGFKFQNDDGYRTWNAYGYQTGSNINGNYSVSYSK